MNVSLYINIGRFKEDTMGFPNGSYYHTLKLNMNGIVSSLFEGVLVGGEIKRGYEF